MNPTLKMWKNRITGLIPQGRVTVVKNSAPKRRNGFFRRVGWWIRSGLADVFDNPALALVKTIFYSSVTALVWLMWFAFIPIAPKGVGEYIAVLPEQQQKCVTALIWKNHQNSSVASGDLWHAKRTCSRYDRNSYSSELARVLNK